MDNRYKVGAAGPVAPLDPIEAPDLQYLDSSTAMWLDIWGWTPEAAATQPEWKLPDPSIFIVGTDGRIEYEYMGLRYGETARPEVVLAAAKALPEKR